VRKWIINRQKGYKNIRKQEGLNNKYRYKRWRQEENIKVSWEQWAKGSLNAGYAVVVWKSNGKNDGGVLTLLDASKKRIKKRSNAKCRH